MRNGSLQFLLIVGLMLSVAGIRSIGAQTRDIPGNEYWLARASYFNGDIATARKAFTDGARGAIKTADGRWVDSTCFHTMLGECYYEMGDLTNALDQHSSALKQILAYPNWMLQIEFPNNIEPAKGVTFSWGTPTRTTRIGKFPEKYGLVQSTLTASAPNAKGDFNLVSGTQVTLINAAEIARCTALSIRRRREILGITGTAERDKLTEMVLNQMQRRPAPPNNWSQCWASIHYGLALSAAGKDTLAISELQKGLQAGGVYDHLMTSLGLLELGDLHFKQGKYETAGVMYLEATYSGAVFSNWDDVEAGFRGAALCWLLTGKNAAFQPLVPATAYAAKAKLPKLVVALKLMAAENLTLLGDTAGAATLLASAGSDMNRRELQNCRAGARWNFEMARVQFANGKLAEGASNLAAAMKFQQASSTWLFQITLADTMVTSKAVSDREGDQLFTELLRDPSAEDWSINPLESLTVASTSYAAALEHWFLIALTRKEPEKAMEIADRLRRHRFYSTLPLGGRLLALRWILEAPKELLDAKAQLQRQDLLIKYPGYSEVSLKAREVQNKLAAMPLVPESDEDRKDQSDLFAQLGKLSAVQEVMLRNIALRREPSDYVFPPTLDVKALQAKLPEKTLVLAYINIGGRLHGFALGREKYAPFTVDLAQRLKTELATIFKAWGHSEKNQVIDIKDLKNDSWRTTARRLLKTLTNDMKDEAWANFEEVVIVPDSVLWYVPFEALPISDEPDAPPLISRLRVRYVPTLALAAADESPRGALDRTAVVAGKLYPRDDIEIAGEQFEKLTEAIPSAVKLVNPLPSASSLFASQFDQLIVYHDLDENAKGPYDWSPCPVDKNKASSTSLADWFSLPWDAPRQVMLPGFHTPAEASLKRGGAGDELFLTSLAFLASGSKTVLLSRWRSAGQSAYDLTREFALESPNSSASAAWQRSVELARRTPLDPSLEPRLKVTDKLDSIDGSHPFFWAGYLLVDTGSQPKTDKPAVKVEEKKPVAKPADAEKKVEEVKKEEAKPPAAKPAAKADEPDGKLPPELEALRKAPAEAGPGEKPAKPMEKPLAPRPAKKS